MRKAYGYIRVSTSAQAIDGVSLEVQTERIKARCLSEGWELAEIFSDKGISGGKMKNRPGLLKALKSTCDNEGNVLVVYNLSRMCRNTRDAIDILEDLRDAGSNLLSISESLDTTTAMGKAMFEIIAVFASLQRELAREGAVAAIKHKMAKGEKVGAAPYGWVWKGEDKAKKLVENAKEQAILDEIFDMRSQGCSLRDISKALNDDDVPTKHGKRWYPMTVKDILDRAR